MKINNIIKAKFIKRPNRFIAYVELNNEEIKVHVPNTGRCKEILIPGTTVILREGKNPNRKTQYDLISAYKEHKLINIDSQIPNYVVEEALKNKKIKTLNKFYNIKREQVFGSSRFDFKLWDDKGNEYYLEVKGVTFEKEGYCMFPDAPTDRGTRHLLELIDVKKSGKNAGVLFLVQFNGANKFSPYEEMDKKFAKALRLAKKEGVDIFCYDCNVGEDYIELNKNIDISL
ncbi:DNA/RNA nuclease SfsA [Clostridium botulinum C]|uniref:Sugar fermentation stimulation protein homolog n=2 Tax=Clostridium botulinum TaxID=1491 RepID=A0A9Q4XUM9_CLOBO|nr:MULTISPECIES: DNA/RNA nuclease SfsA [Clostridium]EGO87598.1 XRE family transcriptional regulator [Clostridium botulinum C str. Stockholm]AYF53976.1 DNA/RNA nuclease SfsA [Clostridium novyi]MCD3196187.1 DNA/RNA nuclease SfsA [Clostridium botulinum C]MCD3201536.1 DNA/RNA nuclease SfsA [Clostridium botulinum C]MCD3207109.1 DNA/RNA nuclease SfsA [Clostridium botulinum C]